ncbi:MAG TPA: chlorite dismutase family protein [Rubricoccaceae bacterium]|nr:chlorite dismutase family protein [Rubricoccaceae bacterium]
MALNVATASPAEAEPHAVGLDLAERGKAADGAPLRLDRRLFVQLLVFDGCPDVAPLARAAAEAGLHGVVYEDLNNPRGAALLTFSEDPAYFAETVRPLVNDAPFRDLRHLPERTLLGRTYSIGYEKNLEEIVLYGPMRRMTNPAWPWAVWYPLRRSGAFEQLSAEEQRTILMEHGGIGRAYGRGDHAHDIRLACHGLDTFDNDFIAGLLGRELFPLSHVVQRMRKTQQTSRYLTSLGPFFVGRARWQAALDLPLADPDAH